MVLVSASPSDLQICPKCGYQNVPDARFCMRCGKSLQTCPNCGFYNSLSARFCKRCGQALQGRGTSHLIDDQGNMVFIFPVPQNPLEPFHVIQPDEIIRVPNRCPLCGSTQIQGEVKLWEYPRSSGRWKKLSLLMCPDHYKTIIHRTEKYQRLLRSNLFLECFAPFLAITAVEAKVDSVWLREFRTLNPGALGPSPEGSPDNAAHKLSDFSGDRPKTQEFAGEMAQYHARQHKFKNAQSASALALWVVFLGVIPLLILLGIFGPTALKVMLASPWVVITVIWAILALVPIYAGTTLYLHYAFPRQRLEILLRELQRHFGW